MVALKLNVNIPVIAYNKTLERTFKFRLRFSSKLKVRCVDSEFGGR